ncbi:MAG: murein biosynthesis integral membrane protein MurJ [Dehalococcoidia bacterium]|nr:murein biosynthesis integral membrane protein MurJ [Dehalococcoidia bacterium]
MAEQPPGSKSTARRDAGGEPAARATPPRTPPPAEPRSRFGRFLVRSQTQSVIGAAGIVAFGFLASRMLGLLRSVVIADAFGTDPELDAYWVAFRLPDLVFQLLAGATLSAAFIPTFSRVLLRSGEEGAWRLASSVLNLVALATFVLAGLAFLLAPWLVPLLAPGLGEGTGREAELSALAVELTRFMLLSPLFFGISGMLTGILNARQHFVAPALAPLVYNLSIILGAIILSEPLGVYGLAWGVVAGALGHLLVQVPVLGLVGMRWRPSFEVYSAGVREVLRLMGPRVIGLAATQVNFLVVIFFASFISSGAISSVTYAFLIMLLPVGVVGMAISTAAFPTLAQQAAAHQYEQLRESLTGALRTILFLAVPASAGLVLLGRPVVRLLLQRGAFEASDTDLVVAALTFYALGVWAHAGIEILSRGFYALSDTKTPVQLAVVAMLLNVVLAAALVGPLELRGLAAAASITAALEFGLLLRVLHVRLGGFDRIGLRRSLGGTLLATAVMTEVVLIMRLLLGAAGADAMEPLGALVVTVAAGGLGLFTYLGASYVTNREEYRALLGRFGG